MTNTTNLQIQIHNAETGEVIIRDMNKEELAQVEAAKIEIAAYEAAKAQHDAEKAALLVRLGLTEDELKTILG